MQIHLCTWDYLLFQELNVSSEKTPCCMLSTVQENKEFGGGLEVS